MNTNDPRLHDLFDEQIQGVRISVDDLADRAIARDRRNRRREVATGMAAGALALAVALPLGWNALGTNRASQVPASPSSVVSTSPVPSQSTATTPTTPTAIPTIQATGATGATLVQLASGPTSATTDLGHLEGNVYVEGSLKIPLPKSLEDPQWIARLGDGMVAVPTRGGDLTIVDASGHTGKSIATISAPVIGDQRSHLVALATNEDLVYYDATGSEVARLTAARCECTSAASHGSWEPVGIIGAVVYANRGHDKGHVRWDTATGEVIRAEGTIDLLNEATGIALVTVPGEVAGDGDLVCRELVDLDTGITRWRLCGAVHFTSFSPDGAYLVGTGLLGGINPEATSGRFGALVVLRTEDAKFALEGGVDGTSPQAVGIVTARMSADQSLTVETSNSAGHGLQRCELDGSCAVITEPSPVDPDLEPGSGYLLSSQ